MQAKIRKERKRLFTNKRQIKQNIEYVGMDFTDSYHSCCNRLVSFLYTLQKNGHMYGSYFYLSNELASGDFARYY